MPQITGVLVSFISFYFFPNVKMVTENHYAQQTDMAKDKCFSTHPFLLSPSSLAL